MSMKGKKHSEETKEKIGIATKSRPNGMQGKKHSKTTKEKMSLSHWKGGIKRDRYGYILIHSPNHPYRNIDNLVPEHRLVMEEHLERYLTPKEVIHHKGIKYPIGSIENKRDNRIENLELFSTNHEHLVFHKKLLKKKTIEKQYK